VRAVLVDGAGRVWFGTAQGGLAQALPAADGDVTFRSYLTDDGVGAVDCIVENRDGSLWLASSDQILEFDPDTGRAEPLHGSQDLGTRGDYDNSCTRQGATLYFGGLDGLLAFDPGRLPAQRALGPVVLTDLWLFNEPLRPHSARAGGLLPRRVQDVESLAFDYRQDVFGFSFAALEFRHPHSVTYRYRLLGLHEDWLPLAQGQRYASFAGVPAGRYVFEVAAQRGTGASRASVVVVVGPPPWRSRPAYALYAAAGLLAFAVLARAYRQRRAREARHVAELSRLANFDALTGLPNRTLFGTELAAALEDGSAPLALFFIDLDRFKNINDSLGHRFGDRVLVAAAARLRDALPPGARLARLGGDEFTAIVTGLADETGAAGVARRLLDAFATPLKVEGSEVVVTLSIGVSLSPAHAADWSTLVQYADSAMYFAKDSGRNAFRFFRPEMTAQVSRRLALETSLRRAVAQGELYPVLQPKIDLATGRVAGSEVLLRWQSAEHGNVAPVEFIPILEDTGMIEGVGLWLLRDVCRQVRDWRAAGRGSLPISINVSVHQLIHRDLYERLAEMLREFGIPPGLLELEVTETAVMDNAAQMAAAVNELRALGFSVAIDDFGTGYSSLAYLSHLPVNTLKIDRAFVVGVGTRESADTLCAAIIAMAHQLDLAVVAEGVETEIQRDRLVAMRCDQAQGNLFSVPLRLDAFEQYLDAHRA
jgi:diguanylate cyclase (GGDEF)-like protein